MPPWLRLSIAGSATLLVGMGLGRFSYSPLIPPLIEGGVLSVSEAGTVAACNFAGYLLGALAAPLLRGRLGELQTVRFCLLLAFSSLVASAIPLGFLWLAFWRTLVGACIGIMMIYALTIVTRAAPPQKLGIATAIVFAGVGVGILCAGTMIPFLLETSLMAAWSGIAFLGGLAVVVAFWGWRAGENHQPQRHREAVAKQAWSPLVLGLIGARTMFSFGLIPHSIYWVDYLVRGLDRDISFGGMHWGLFGLGAIGGTFLWGMLADRVGFRVALVLAFAALGIGTALPVLHIAGWSLVFSSLVVGAQPGVSAILSGRMHQLMGADGMAIVWRRSALIATIVQAVGSYAYVALFAYSENYVPLFLMGAAAMFIGALISCALRLPDHPPRQ